MLLRLFGAVVGDGLPEDVVWDEELFECCEKESEGDKLDRFAPQFLTVDAEKLLSPLRGND